MLVFSVFLFWLNNLIGSLDFGPRAQVARFKFKHRTLAAALEAYQVQHGEYPEVITRITTPVSYVSSRDLPDLLSKGNYRTLYWKSGRNWFLVANGPDQKFQIDASTTASLFTDRIYDPTNGSNSRGDIVRTNFGVFEPEQIPNF